MFSLGFPCASLPIVGLLSRNSAVSLLPGCPLHRLAAYHFIKRIHFLGSNPSTPLANTPAVPPQLGFSPQVHLIAAWDPSKVIALVEERLFCQRTGTHVPFSYEEHPPSVRNNLAIKVSQSTPRAVGGGEGGLRVIVAPGHARGGGVWGYRLPFRDTTTTPHGWLEELRPGREKRRQASRAGCTWIESNNTPTTKPTRRRSCNAQACVRTLAVALHQVIPE